MIGLVAMSLASVIVLAVAAVLGYRASRQRRTARELVIGTAHGIAESRYITVGGIEQWIQIRGEDRANPVLLFVHGAGMSMVPFTSVLRCWEEHFTVVQWDRRGTGRTGVRNGTTGSDTWTFDLFAGDGVEVAQYLCDYLGQDKVILLGHSQGTIVAMAMAQRRPDLFRAYVGTGQIADMARTDAMSYKLAVQRARATGSKKSARELARLRAPVYPTARAWITKQRWSFATDPELQVWSKKALRMVLTAPDMTLRDIYRFNAAIMNYPQPLYEETMAWTARQQGTRFDIPCFIIHGAADDHTLTSLAEELFAMIEAPAKDLVLLANGGHCVVLMQPAAFLDELRARVGATSHAGLQALSPDTPQKEAG
jgi:pimeloyl-ACP methyl ester carboxylesterase